MSGMEAAEAIDLDASRAEAARLLEAARWRRVLVTGTLVGGVDPVGNVHIKDWAKIPPGHELYSEDTPDTPHEAAAWLVAKFANGASTEGPRYAFRRRKDVARVLDTFAPMPEAKIAQIKGESMPQPINIQVNPVFNVTGGHATSDAANDANATEGAANEAYGETGETGVTHSEAADENSGEHPASSEFDDLGSDVYSGESAGIDEVGMEPANASMETESLADVLQSEAADEAPEAVADSVDSGTDDPQDDAAEDLESADGGGAGGGLQVLHGDGQDGAGDSDLPYAVDADFEEIGAEAEQVESDDRPDYPELEPPSLGDEILSTECEAGGVAYFGDDFPTMKLKKLGRLAQIARERIAAHEGFSGWSDDEWAAVHSHVVSNLSEATGAYAGESQETYDRFTEMAAAKAHIDDIKRHRDQCTEYLESPDTPRALIEQFDPEIGWPE